MTGDQLTAHAIRMLLLVLSLNIDGRGIDRSFAGWTRAGLHPNAMIHIIRFAGELNVFHYCHSSEEVGGEGRRGCRR